MAAAIDEGAQTDEPGDEHRRRRHGGALPRQRQSGRVLDRAGRGQGGGKGLLRPRTGTGGCATGAAGRPGLRETRLPPAAHRPVRRRLLRLHRPGSRDHGPAAADLPGDLPGGAGGRGARAGHVQGRGRRVRGHPPQRVRRPAERPRVRQRHRRVHQGEQRAGRPRHEDRLQTRLHRTGVHRPDLLLQLAGRRAPGVPATAGRRVRHGAGGRCRAARPAAHRISLAPRRHALPRRPLPPLRRRRERADLRRRRRGRGPAPAGGRPRRR